MKKSNKLLLATAVLIFITGCSVVKIPKVSAQYNGGRLIELSYDYNNFQDPQVNWEDAKSKASSECLSLGYRPIKDSENPKTICTETSPNGNCIHYRVSKLYTCGLTAKQIEEDNESIRQAKLEKVKEEKERQEKKATEEKNCANTNISVTYAEGVASTLGVSVRSLDFRRTYMDFLGCMVTVDTSKGLFDCRIYTQAVSNGKIYATILYNGTHVDCGKH